MLLLSFVMTEKYSEVRAESFLSILQLVGISVGCLFISWCFCLSAAVTSAAVNVAVYLLEHQFSIAWGTKLGVIVLGHTAALYDARQ